MQAGIWCGTKQVLSFLFSVLCCHQLIFARFSYKPCTSPLWFFPSQIIKSLLSFVWFVSALLPLSATVKRQLIYCCLLLSLKTALIYPLKTYYLIVLHAICYFFVCLFKHYPPSFLFLLQLWKDVSTGFGFLRLNNLSAPGIRGLRICGCNTHK